MKRFFTEHPATVGETYGEHFAFAISVGGRMVGGGLACMLHAVFPEFCKTTGSRTIRELALRLVPSNREKRRIRHRRRSPSRRRGRISALPVPVLFKLSGLAGTSPAGKTYPEWWDGDMLIQN